MSPHRTLPCPARLVVLASGAGTLLQALLDACADRPADAGAAAPAPFRVVAVVSDTPVATALDRARTAGVATAVVPPSAHPTRADWDVALAATLAGHRPDLVVCAGFMRLLGPAVLAGAGPVVNTHPALLPAFPGAHGVRDALAHGVRVTGATAHLVDAGVDTGPILAQTSVEVEADDDEASLHERIKTVERVMLVDVLTRMVRGGWSVDGRKVHLA